MAPLTPCPDRLCQIFIKRFLASGFLAFENLLTAEEVNGALAAITELASGADQHPGLLAQTEPGHDPDTADPEACLRKLMNWRTHHAALSAIAEHPRLNALVGSILGNDPICFQDMALIKPPRIGSEKPWHQDAAYFDVLPLDAVVGVWIALDPSTSENGCMHVLPGAHLEGPRRHVMAPVLAGRPGGGGPVSTRHTDCQLVEVDEADALAVPLPPGGVLLFSSLLPHRTPPNLSGRRRRALQLHYRAHGTQHAGRTEYDRVFVDEQGRPASCATAGA